jgi:hypothetical protein
MLQDRLKMNGDAARAYIQKMDQDRQKWTHYLYGVDWGDPALYDVVLNLETMDIRQACDVIEAMARQECFKETPESRSAMNDLALASRVRANLVTAPETANIEVDVAARDGAIVIRGKLSNRDQIEDVEAIVRRVPGVTNVDLDLFTDVQV